MKLAIVTTHPIQYNAPLFRLMAKQKDLEIHVFFSRTSEQMSYDPDFQRQVIWDTPLTDGYTHSRVDATGTVGIENLKQSVKSFKPHALIVYGWNFPGHRQMIRTFYGQIPVGFRGDSHLLNPMTFWKRWLRKAVLHRIYRHVDLAFSVGTANTAYFQWSGMPEANIVLAPHSVDNAYWQQDAIARQQAAEQWKTELGIPKTDSAIGFAGKLEPLKQVDLLIKAFERIASQKIHLIIAGTGPDEEKLKQQAANHPRIHFAGFVNQSRMPIFYRMLSAFVLPSSSETWGLSVNEALACGTRCMVSNRVGCGQDIFKDPRLGTIVKWDRPFQWTSELETLLKNPEIEGDALHAFLETYSYSALIEALPKLWST